MRLSRCETRKIPFSTDPEVSDNSKFRVNQLLPHLNNSRSRLRRSGSRSNLIEIFLYEIKEFTKTLRHKT